MALRNKDWENAGPNFVVMTSAISGVHISAKSNYIKQKVFIFFIFNIIHPEVL